jgi:hypothetical protein
VKVLLVLLVLLLGAAVVADRVGEGVAEDRIAAEVAERGGLTGTPAVDVTGWPFLTQALGGRYEDVRITLTAEQLGQPVGTSADLSLRGVHLPLSAAISGSVEQVPVDRVDGTATLSYALLAAQLGGDTTLAPEGDGVRVTRTVEVLGVEVPLTATGTLRLDGDAVVVDVGEAEAAGVGVPDFVVDRADDLLDFRYPVPALPFGLQVTDVRPAEDGVDAALEATDVVLQG